MATSATTEAVFGLVLVSVQMDISGFLLGLCNGFVERLSYSVKHMSVPQWGILSVVALIVGVIMMKSRR